MKNEKTLALTRLIIGFITMFNLILASRGYRPLEFNETMITTVVSGGLAFATYLWSWWKNNNISHNARQAQHFKNVLDKDVKGE